MNRPFRSVLVSCALALAARANATTIVPIADQSLVDRSPVVVVATVESRAAIVADRPATDWTVVVESVLKGTVNASRIVLRIPGGQGPDGHFLRIWGAPPLRPGVRGIFFLVPNGQDLYQLADFPQGAFVGARTSQRTIAFRDFSQVNVIGDSRSGSRSELRDFDRFANWIEDRASGTIRAQDYAIQPSKSELATIVGEYTLFENGGLNMRWFNFDSGGSVTYKTAGTAPAGIGALGSLEVQRALAAWTNEPTTPIKLVYGGATSALGGLKTYDNQNVLLFGDPNNEIAGAFDCSIGGTLAIGGPWYSVNPTGKFNNKTFIRIQGGDVVFNDGIDCKAFSSPNFSKFIEEVAGHEVGHTLGLGHSSESQFEPNPVLKGALMYYRAKDNGLGAVLNSDDIAAIQYLYRKGGSGGGGGGGGSVGCPAGTPANTLCLLKGRFRVTGSWTSQFDGSSGAAVPILNSDYSGFFYFSDKNNIELIVKILDFGSSIKVFYSELTNLRFSLIVTDSSTGRSKTYSNTPGECGAIDQNFAASTAAAASGLSALGANASTACVPGTNTLCLLNGRFAVTVDWRNQFDGTSGLGRSKPLTSLTGAFSFNDPANLEILIKTLDFGDHVLVIYGSLSNFEYTIHVTDTSTGLKKDYKNAAGNYCGGLDTNAF